MSKIGNYRVGLQERPEYQDGYEAAERGERYDHHPYPVGSVEQNSWLLGWNDCHQQAQMEGEQ